MTHDQAREGTPLWEQPELIEKVLAAQAEHEFTSFSTSLPRGSVEYHRGCTCGLRYTWEKAKADSEHAAHLAAVGLAAVGSDIAASAWSDGMEAGHDCTGTDPRSDCFDKNPYRQEAGR